MGSGRLGGDALRAAAVLLVGCVQGPASTAVSLGFDVTPMPRNIQGRSLLLTATPPAGVVVECTANVYNEVHRFERPEVAAVHEIAWTGLLADTVYHCEAATLGHPATTASHAVRVGSLPREPALSGTGSSAASWGAWTVLLWDVRADLSRHIVIVDPDGRLRWIYEIEAGPLPGIEVTVTEEGKVLAGGGPDYPPRLLSLSGDPEWVMPPLPDGEAYHHDVELHGDEIVALATETFSGTELEWIGFQVLGLGVPTGDTRWRVSSAHAVEAGDLMPGSTPGEDVYHANAVSMIDDHLTVSLAQSNQIIRLDAGSGEALWQLGAGLDFQLLDPAGVPVLDDAAWFYGQHDPEWHGDRVLMLDNGTTPLREPRYSRALELEVDPAAGTARILWEWRDPGWFSPIMGDADRLPNGNVLLSRPRCYTCPSSVRSSIVELDPATDEVVWRLDFLDDTDSLYRAERVDGCALFDHAGYCDALAR